MSLAHHVEWLTRRKKLASAQARVFERAGWGGWAAAGFPACGPGGWRRCATGRRCPARCAGLARPGGVGEAPQQRGRAPRDGGVALCRVHARPRRPCLHRPVPEPAARSLLDRGQCRADPDPRLDRRLDLPAQRVRGAGPKQRRCRGGGELRPRAPGPPGGERRRSQLCRGLERPGFAAHLDQAQHAGRAVARPFCAPGLRRPGRARGGGERGAGAIWMDVYDAVTTRAGRYVQGGGCTTVGVAGLVQGGGFGAFSKGFGTAAANLLEAEVVTADGAVRIANAARNPDLFWALKGGGGGTFGVVTRLTLRTHALPAYVGAVRTMITAASDAAYATLAGQVRQLAAHRYLAIPAMASRRMSVALPTRRKDSAAASPVLIAMTPRPDPPQF